MFLSRDNDKDDNNKNNNAGAMTPDFCHSKLTRAESFNRHKLRLKIIMNKFPPFI